MYILPPVAADDMVILRNYVAPTSLYFSQILAKGGQVEGVRPFLSLLSLLSSLSPPPPPPPPFFFFACLSTCDGGAGVAATPAHMKR